MSGIRVPHPPQLSSAPLRTVAVGAVGAAVLASVLVLGGCGGSSGGGLLLGGPNTDVVVTIPDGWHQVINSTNPIIPEAVAPTTCMGRGEESCATGLVRIASLIAPNVQAAEHIVGQGIASTPGVKLGKSISEGPGKVGAHDGYRHRFSFSNPGATLTAEIAAVPSGPDKTDAHGNREFSVILAEVSDKSGAPDVSVLDDIIGSAKVSAGDGKPPA